MEVKFTTEVVSQERTQIGLVLTRNLTEKEQELRV